MARTFLALAALALLAPFQSLAAPTGRCSGNFIGRPGRPGFTGRPVPSASPSLSPSEIEPVVEPTPVSEEPIPSVVPPQPEVTPPETSPAPAPAPEPTNSPVEAGLTDVQRRYLDTHNNFRAKYNAKAMTWSATLEASAQKVANACSWAHTNSGYGENFAAGTGNVTPEGAIQLWLNEAKDYNPAKPQYSHFTQVVWKSSTELGCATAKCTSGLPIGSPSQPATFTVCHYNPAGNVIGQFDQNVEIP